MFFILSKLLYFLLIPFTWVLLLLLWYGVTRSPRLKRRLLITIIIITVVFTNPLLYRKTVMLWQAPPVDLPEGKKFETGILLTGMVGFDKYDRGFFGGSSDRFIQATNLYHRGVIKKILVTGGTGSLLGREPSEAVFLRKELMANGIRQEDIITEPASRNTYENALFSKKIIDSIKLQPPFLLITSALHMPRSEAVFKKAGIAFTAYPCNYEVVENRFAFDDDVMPDVKLLKTWSYFLKEVVGLMVYRFTGKA